MKLISILAGVGLLAFTHAVDMSHYSPQAGVEAGFFEYIKSLYASTEDSSSTTSFYDYFSPPGNLTVNQMIAIGYDKIIALKQQINPPEGYKRLNHKPNITSVFSETPTQKVYQVFGVIQTTNLMPTVLNCSQAYYQSHFTILKDKAGKPILTPHGKSLTIYDDYFVDPAGSPTNISCKASN